MIMCSCIIIISGIILKLLSFNDEKVKLWVYTCINKQMKQFLGVHKSAFTSLRTTLDIATGIPINSEIIIEIACRGIQHQNREVCKAYLHISVLVWYPFQFGAKSLQIKYANIIIFDEIHYFHTNNIIDTVFSLLLTDIISCQ